MSAIPWTNFFILLAAGLLGAAAVLPYAFSMNPQVMEKLKDTGTKNASSAPEQKNRPVPSLPVLLLISILQSLVLLSVAVYLGLLAAGQVGLGTPILSAALEGQPVMGKILEILPPTLLLAVVSAAVMLALEWAYFLPRIPRQIANLDGRTAFWKRVLACFYGGIDEEIFMRLFLMSGLVWLLGLVWKDTAGAPAVGAFWLANFIAALLFGAGHLPATAGVAKLTPHVVARALLLNGVPGIACGYLYMVYGLEAAVLAHFTLDIILHLIALPLMAKRADSLPLEQIDPAAQPS